MSFFLHKVLQSWVHGGFYCCGKAEFIACRFHYHTVFDSFFSICNFLPASFFSSCIVFLSLSSFPPLPPNL